MKHRLLSVCVLIAGLAVVPDSRAQGGVFSPENPSIGRKVRNLGMGNTGVAIRGTADSSPFYNPAGLNDLEKGRFQFLTMTGEIARGSLELIGDTKDFVNAVDEASNDADRVRELDNFISDNQGKFQRLRFAMDLVNYTRPNFAAGVILDQRMDLSFRNPSYQSFDVRNLGDVALFVAGSHAFLGKNLVAGVALRPTVRFALDEHDQSVTLADVLADDASGDPLLKSQFEKIYKERRFGLGVDLGIKTDLAFGAFKDSRIYSILKPSAGLTWQDIGSPRFGAASENPQSVSMGVAVHPDWKRFKNIVALDIREMNQGRPFLSKLHIGAETVFDWIVDFGVRAGISQGYFTAGMTVDFRYVRLDAAYYHEEVGRNTRQDGSARLAATLSFNI